MHHIITDGYSLGLLDEDINRSLAGEPVAPEHMAFSEYVARKAKADKHTSDDREYADALMAGVESFMYPYRLPEESARADRAATIHRNVVMDEIGAWCRRNSLTHSSYFHAALLLTLYLLTGETPFIATTYSGRAEYPEALRRTVGFFAKSVPVVWSSDGADARGDLHPDTFVRRIQAQVMDTCSRDGVLYSDLSVRTDVLLTFHGALGLPHIDRIGAEVLAPEVPIFTIHLEVRPDGATAGLSLHYDKALFREADMRLLGDAFERVLERLCKAPVLRDIRLVETADASLLRARSGPRMPIEAGMRGCVTSGSRLPYSPTPSRYAQKMVPTPMPSWAKPPTFWPIGSPKRE